MSSYAPSPPRLHLAPDTTLSTPKYRLWAEQLLFVCFMVYTFVGLHPFQDPEASSRAGGSILDRIFVPLVFLLGLFVMSFRWREALACVKSNAAIFALVFFCMASWLWSDYPHLTLRRSLLLFFITGITMAVAVCARDIRRLHTMLFVSLIIVTVINLLGSAAMPHIAVTDIGVRGLYTQKNVAGVVAMITMIIGVTWLLGATGKREITWGLIALVPVFVFLVLTKSKTSLNLTILGSFVVVFFALAERYGARFILASAAVGLLIVTALIAFMAISGMTLEAILGLGRDNSFSGRDELWAFARSEAKERYWLGHGYGAFWDVGLTNDPLTRTEPGSWLSEVKPGIINQAHDGYLELWLNAGLPATVFAALIIIYGAVSGAIKSIFGRGDRATRAAFACFAALLGLHLVHNLTEATLFLRGANYCTTALLALFVLSRSGAFLSDRPEGDRHGRHPS